MADGQLPDGWQVWRIDEIVDSISERIDPAEADVDIYVGLEHLDSESLQEPCRFTELAGSISPGLSNDGFDRRGIGASSDVQ